MSNITEVKLHFMEQKYMSLTIFEFPLLKAFYITLLNICNSILMNILIPFIVTL